MNYKIGTSDPIIHPDRGAGPWNSEPVTTDAVAEKVAIIEALPGAALIIGTDAAANLLHYFENTGSPQTINVEKMIRDVPSARRLFDEEVARAQRFVESNVLQPGASHITSNSAAGGYNTEAESKNWFFAVGGYSAWGKGVATVPNLGVAPAQVPD